MYYLFGDVITNGKVLPNYYVGIDGEYITEVGTEPRFKQAPVYYEEGNYICPGLIDVHIHGVHGLDFMDVDQPKRFSTMASHLARHGVTSFLATSRTSSMEDLLLFLDEVSHFDHQNSQILGVHLEGPWISEKYRGAQPTSYIRPFSEDDLSTIIKPYHSLIKKITLAPELVEHTSRIQEVEELGIRLSMGHTDASFDTVQHVTEQGVHHMTHTFNAMSPFHHRTPGAAAAALYFKDINTEIIADSLHVHPAIIKLLYNTKGKDYVVVVSDCTGYDHLEDGTYHMRGKTLIKRGKGIYLEQGNLAGSSLLLIQMLKVLVEQCNIPIEDVIYMMTQTPIKTLTVNQKVGQLKKGYRANAIVLDHTYQLKYTIVNGAVVN
ncbi:N-acetylglucosamine-6-phosphate deacetylase [Aquisalibacillus elongatus]|uniref:N-acetylglucosamine 6-phosphate deacetylase n=1 Tax=Aquisalibacillus elongatus TaxID=485577 RepID=A0A3N5BX03_9BACI|nr:N-acetylglucosamine-6-phosphate deacetylase [Aquisalibacillus elongatus]RPF54288.1 N-acetylglucosamine 6-phosphate deacetylase [Aquisalibacillus elongatus]